MKRVNPAAAFALLFIGGVPSCDDTRVQTDASPFPTSVDAIRLDPNALHAVGARVLFPGERVSMQALPGGVNDVVQISTIVRDTSVISIDSQGTLFALHSGTSWLVWTQQGRQDSSRIAVSPKSPPASLYNDWAHPELPATVDVRYPTGRSRAVATEKVWRVAAGGDLQGVLNQARPGDEIVLSSGAKFTGNFVLPNKQSSSAWIVVRAELLPVAPGSRTTPAFAAASAEVITPNQNAAIQTAPGASHWRLVGFQVSHAKGSVYNYGIVVLGGGSDTNLSLLPNNIVLDRMFIHGSTTDGTSRCVAFNGIALAVIDSWLSECHARGQDAQGVAGWGGPGPFLIENNHIEASGEIILFGGADPRIVNMTPSDITIRRNYLGRPLSWAGQWSIKNIFELKHAKRVLFEGNVMENNWADGQSGFAILFQALSQDNSAPWTTVQDVLVQNNILRNSASGANLLSRVAYGGGSVPTTPSGRIAFVNNLFQDVGRDPINGGGGRIFQLLSDLQDVSLVNNTVTLNGQTGQAVGFDGAATTRTTIVNNIFPLTDYGIFGSGMGSGSPALAAFAPSSTVTGNVLPGQNASAYPANNFGPATGFSTSTAGGINSDSVCLAVRTWLSQNGLPGAAGADCEVLDSATKGVTRTPP